VTRSVERKLRIGLTGPKGPFARQVREVFQENAVPVSRFVPLGSAEEDGKLSEIDGEAEFLQSPSREAIADLDLLILAGSPTDADCRAFAAASDVPAFDIADVPPAAEGCSAIFSALDPLPAEGSFTVLLPASEAGAGGIEELFAQAGASLNFRPAEAAVFSSRLAFNVFRDAAVESLETAVRSSLERRFSPCRISVLCARIAVFHGYAASALLRFPTEAESKNAVRQLGKSRELSLGDEPGGASTAAAVEGTRVLVDPPAAAAESVSLWFAFDGLDLAAKRALRAASRLLG
jgi:aspartate-semialdehyde dehydrogenase